MKNPDVLRRLGRRIKSIRTARGYTQEQLAKQCRYTSKFISEIERGLVNVPTLTLAKIGARLDVTLSELMLGVDGMPNVAGDGSAIYAGRSRDEQAALKRVFTAISELIAAKDTAVSGPDDGLD